MVLTSFILCYCLWHFHYQYKPAEAFVYPVKFSTTHLSDAPIIEVSMHTQLEEEVEQLGYTSVNGPTLIKVPDWVVSPFGKYYLYFAHHKGPNIRMAYADSLTGPWELYEGNVLTMEQSTMSTNSEPAASWEDLRRYTSYSEAKAIYQVGQAAKAAYEKRVKEKLKSSPPTTPHIASPEIYIDHDKQIIRLYFHGVIAGNIQMSKVATSKNGVDFKARPEIIGLPYMRVFKHRDEFFALSMPGVLYRSKNGLTDFIPRKRWIFDPHIRHSALLKRGNVLYIFHSRVGDRPEQILCSIVDLTSDNWNHWKASKPVEVCRSELDWEGAFEEVLPSIRGEIGTLVHQLRDPYVYEEREKLYLLYSGGGEQNIGIRTLNINDLTF